MNEISTILYEEASRKSHDLCNMQAIATGWGKEGNTTKSSGKLQKVNCILQMICVDICFNLG